MKNRYIRIVLFFIAIIILLASLLSFIKDFNFFLNRKEANAEVLSIENMGVQASYRVKLKYFNKDIKDYIICSVTLKKSYGRELNEGNNHSVDIYYVNNLFKSVYLVEYGSPRLGILFFDLIMIVLMLIAVLALKSHFKKEV